MNNMDKQNDGKEEDVRQPDAVKVEQLINNYTLFTPLTEQQQINMTILKSIEDMKKTQQEQDEYEKEVLKQYKQMKLERENQVKELIGKLKKLAKFDKSINNLIELIEPVVDAYCLGYIQKYEYDEITYETIFTELKSIKISTDTIMLLKTIITRSS